MVYLLKGSRGDMMRDDDDQKTSKEDLIYFYISEFIFRKKGKEFREEEFIEYLLDKVKTTRVDEFRSATDWLCSMTCLGLLRNVRPGVYSLK